MTYNETKMEEQWTQRPLVAIPGTKHIATFMFMDRSSGFSCLVSLAWLSLISGILNGFAHSHTFLVSIHHLLAHCRMNLSIMETVPGIFQKLKDVAHSLGMASLEFFDGCGNTVQMEIRPPSSLDYKIPHRECRTHLMRLLVSKSLNFFLEVLGQSVITGTFLPETSAAIDPHLIENVLGSLNGSVMVCEGRGYVRPELTEPSRRKEAIREGVIDGNFITYPDLRYRSYDCEYLVDTHKGTNQCSSCAQPCDPCYRDILPNTLDLSDLKRLDSNQGSRNDPQDDQGKLNIIEHHHHHHHHYYRDGSSPISFLYQDPNAPPPLNLTIE